jgi:acetyl-CoA C-acetyltransferase
LNKLKTAIQFRPEMLSPVIALLNGLTDPVVNLNMGQTAENLVYQFNITREEMDAYSVMSHQRAVTAMEKGYFDEIMPLYDWQGNVIDFDNGVRKDSSIQKLATLKPAFDRPFGTVTAGNSSQISDGAAFLILASESAVNRYKLPVLGRIVDTAWSALDPAVMGLGPVHAIHKLMSKQKLAMEDIDYWEINEAFAAQMLACLKALQDEEYLSQFNISKPLGAIPLDRLNVDGGAIAIGHPVGATGARLVLHLLQILKRNNAKRGIASLCIGGGQGGAMLIENLQEVS